MRQIVNCRQVDDMTWWLYNFSVVVDSYRSWRRSLCSVLACRRSVTSASSKTYTPRIISSRTNGTVRDEMKYIQLHSR